MTICDWGKRLITSMEFSPFDRTQDLSVNSRGCSRAIVIFVTFCLPAEITTGMNKTFSGHVVCILKIPFSYITWDVFQESIMTDIIMVNVRYK